MVSLLFLAPFSFAFLVSSIPPLQIREYLPHCLLTTSLLHFLFLKLGCKCLFRAERAVKPRFPAGQVLIILFLQRPWMDGGVCAGWGCVLGGRGSRQRIALAINIGQLQSSVPGVPGKGEPHLGPALQRWPWCHLREAARRGPGTVAGEDGRAALLEPEVPGKRSSFCSSLGPVSAGGLFPGTASERVLGPQPDGWQGEEAA